MLTWILMDKVTKSLEKKSHRVGHIVEQLCRRQQGPAWTVWFGNPYQVASIVGRDSQLRNSLYKIGNVELLS
jgi:hypothetical protein